MGFTHAVTIDTDGQLDPAEIPKLLRIARLSPAALVLGTRDAQCRRLSAPAARVDSGPTWA